MPHDQMQNLNDDHYNFQMKPYPSEPRKELLKIGGLRT